MSERLQKFLARSGLGSRRSCEQLIKSNKVFGVVSEHPAFLMNKDAGNDDSHPMIALKGRVRVKVIGTGEAGDRLVSAGNGEAMVAPIADCTAFNVIGRLIDNKYNTETDLHECVIGVK